MAKEYWTTREVLEIFDVQETFLVELEQEEIICPTCGREPDEKLFPYREMEKLRVAKILSEELGVNMAGVEIILRMRENMFEMRTQFDDILEDLSRQLESAFRNRL